MVKCPFCQYENEEGALFCEQCKSDLGMLDVAPAPAVPPAPPPGITEPEFGAVPLAAPAEPTLPLAEDSPPVEMPQAAPALAVPLAEAAPVVDEVPPAVPLAAPVAEAAPVEEAAPLAEPVPEPRVPTAEPTYSESAAVTAAPPAPSEPGTPSPAAAPAAPAAAPEPAPVAGQPRLVVLRGLKLNVEYPIYEGHNFVGRADEQPVDIDLDDQEPPDRVWSSRQHALITLENGALLIEDLNSSNGTFVNRTRVYPGQKRPLSPNDVIQIGTVQMRVKV